MHTSLRTSCSHLLFTPPFTQVRDALHDDVETQGVLAAYQEKLQAWARPLLFTPSLFTPTLFTPAGVGAPAAAEAAHRGHPGAQNEPGAVAGRRARQGGEGARAACGHVARDAGVAGDRR